MGRRSDFTQCHGLYFNFTLFPRLSKGQVSTLGRSRTSDPLVRSQMLCPLSYKGILLDQSKKNIKERVGFEPTRLLHLTVFKTVPLSQTRAPLHICSLNLSSYTCCPDYPMQPVHVPADGVGFEPTWHFRTALLSREAHLPDSGNHPKVTGEIRTHV